jgi:diguanylate cyclase (GGDEF)-like protein
MPLLKMTLQNRITSLLVISSILLISIFTVIQLNNQLTNINLYNTDQANHAAFLSKSILEAYLRQAQANEIPEYLKSALKQLRDSQVLSEAIVFDPEGKILAATDERLIGENTRYKDIERFQDLEKLEKENKWFMLEVDKLKNCLEIYVAIKSDSQGKITYLAKLYNSLGNIPEAFLAVYKPVILSIILIILANILVGFFLSKSVVGPVKMLNEVTKIIAQGDLTVRTNIQTNDELEELSSTFNNMTQELVKMKERAENANPLTKLPGNIVIHEETEKRIRENQKFMVIYCDLDNFKAFNDKYGIAKGDEAIKLTAEILKEAAKNMGNPGDFVGHEGGDDFILLTTPEKAQGVADYITSEFDKRVRSLYNQEDLSQGFIISHGRDGSTKQFSIMTISLAGATNAHRPITSYAEVTNIAAEVKNKAKSIGASVFVIDKRLS